ncbi:MAG TPA: MBL fold metallo-hydrolase [Candidatus Ozemobacteraceae bacterium]|nr:MBL fold metallo-hydrolase [Candidatus Ozemobacteraceae bacterium]
MFRLRARQSLFLLICLVLLHGCLLPGMASAQGKAASGQKKPLPDGWLEVAFIDVGKGDAAIIRLPDGKTCLIDTGYEKTSADLLRNLEKRGIRSLDLVVVTHEHKDHAGGYPAVVKALPIGRTIRPIDPRDPARTLLVHPGDVLLEGSRYSLTALGPSKAHPEKNDASLVLKLTFGAVSFLFAADALADGQADLCTRKDRLRADVLKVPHHGTGLADVTETFFSAVRPRYAVITCDEPDGDVPETPLIAALRKLGTTVLRTDENGNIVFRSDGADLTMKP